MQLILEQKFESYDIEASSESNKSDVACLAM